MGGRVYSGLATVWLPCAAALPAILYLVLVRDRLRQRALAVRPLSRRLRRAARHARSPLCSRLVLRSSTALARQSGAAAVRAARSIRSTSRSLAALAALVAWAADASRIRAHAASSWLGAALFVALNGIGGPHRASVGRRAVAASSLLASKPLQAALTLTWTADRAGADGRRRRGDGVRTLWMVGAALLARSSASCSRRSRRAVGIAARRRVPGRRRAAARHRLTWRRCRRRRAMRASATPAGGAATKGDGRDSGCALRLRRVRLSMRRLEASGAARVRTVIFHVRQHARHAVLRHLVRRIARSGDRLRRRRLSAGPGARRSRHPARARSPPARHVAPRHAAARARHGGDPVRRVRGPHDRHADRAPDPQRGLAQQGLREHRRHVPSRPRRLHVLAEVRHPRLSRRRPRSRRAKPRCASRPARSRRSGCGERYGVRDPRPPDAARTATRFRSRAWSTSTPIRSSSPTRRSCRSSKRSWTRCASRATRAARASRSSRAACRSAGASRSTASSTPTSPRR